MIEKIMGLVFGGIGAVNLVIVLFFTIGNLNFISQAATAEGEVIRLNGKNSEVYNSVIRFTTSNGQVIQFTNSVGSNPPEFQIGQKVKVYYNLDNPAGSAVPDSFLSFWFRPLLFGLFTLIFGGIGSGFYLAYYFAQQKMKWLQRNGQRVTAQIVSIQLNTRVRNQGKSPHVIVAQWLNPQSGQMHSFTSGNIWLDPLPFTPGSSISILFDPNNLRRYYIDTSPIGAKR